MLDHITIGVRDLAKSRIFYDRALIPLGVELLYTDGKDFAGYGAGGRAFFWLNSAAGDPKGIHIAFVSRSRNSVGEFYAAALLAGATCNGPPGLRPQYNDDYYAAFVLDFDGNNIEAVCRQAE